jgi:RNA polymerase sigma-70 factor (ECF subfamily)
MDSLSKLTDHERIQLLIKAIITHAFELWYCRIEDKMYSFCSCVSWDMDKYLAGRHCQDVLDKSTRAWDTYGRTVYRRRSNFCLAMRIAHNRCVISSVGERTPTLKTGDDTDIFELLELTEEMCDSA